MPECRSLNRVVDPPGKSRLGRHVSVRIRTQPNLIFNHILIYWNKKLEKNNEKQTDNAGAGELKT